ncbi:MAG: hypothetical protein O3A00_01745 [Planctomycetota bacterium]|nr:hypothetical protein [Planctomycetota bacterium]
MTAIDWKKAKLAAACESPGTLYAVAHDALRQMIYAAGSQWTMFRVDLAAKDLKAEPVWTNHDNFVSGIVIHQDVVISVGYDRRIVWTKTDDGKTLRQVEGAHDGWIRDVALIGDGSKLATVGDDMLVKMWATESGKLLKTFDGHLRKTPQGFSTALYALAVSPDGNVLASGDRIGAICLWDKISGKLLRKVEATDFYTYDPVKRSRSIGGIRSMCFAPDGKRLVISGIGQVTNVDGFVGPQRVELWDWNAGQRVFAGQDNHQAVLNEVAVHSQTGAIVAAGGGDGGGILSVWDPNGLKLIHKVKPKGHIQQFLFAGNGEQLIAAGADGVQVWDLTGTAPDPEPAEKPKVSK